MKKKRKEETCGRCPESQPHHSSADPRHQLVALIYAAPNIHTKNGGVYDEDMGGIGHIVLSNLDAGGSGSASAPKLQIRKQENGKQLSGSDVLWALQRAAAKNKLKKKNKKKKQASSADTRREDDDDVDCGTNVEVKPLCIKSEWAAKLDELDKRLQELSEFT